jgi:LacI family transcriptional regulator
MPAGMEPQPSLVVEAGLVEQAGFEAVQQVLDLPKPPTAIVAVNDSVAVGVYDALAARRIRIPHDIAITGYNDIPLAHRLQPGLTTIRVAASELGRTSAQILLQQIEDGSPDPRRVVLDPELVVRGSTDPKKP